MRTAVDSSVLLDVFGADPQFGERSRHALQVAYDRGTLILCEVVWAEVRAHFPSFEDFEDKMALLGAHFDPLSPQAATLAGQLWRERRLRSKQPRDRVIADFLIGSHALFQADALLTRDRGFYRQYFVDLDVIRP